MDKVSVGFEIVTYLHICKNTDYIKIVEEKYFSNKYIQRLFRLTKAFHKKYNEIPFDFDEPSTEQIEHILEKNVKLYKFADDLTDDDNELRNTFLENINNVISHNYKKYKVKVVDDNFRSWVMWKNFEEKLDESISYVRGQKIENDNVKSVIDKAMSIIKKANSNLFDDEEGSKSFWDVETHKQPDPEEVQSTGFENLDYWFSPYGGLVDGNLVIFIGATNIGKSIVLINIALGLALNGYNVALASLEMAEYAIASRGGSNLFDVDYNEYGFFTENLEKVQIILESYKKRYSESRPVGELIMKQFHKATPNSLNNWVVQEETDRNIKINTLVVDYLGEMGNDHNTGQGTPYESYIYHKQNTQDLASNAINHKYSVITAHQDKEISKEATDMSLNNLSESKGISHKADSVIGLIQPPEAKLNGRFYMKNLKGRNSKYLEYFLEFDIDYSRMRLTERAMHEPGNLSI